MDTQKESHENPLRHLWGFLSEVVWSVSRWFSGYRNPVDDPLNNPEKAYGKLEEDKYKAELELVDRYQSYVAELLRLSLLGIAVFGFLYKDVHIGGVAKALAVLGVLSFAVATVAALIFRFAATEGARYYIEGLHFREDLDDKERAKAKGSLDNRYDRIVVARLTKPIAVFTLGLGGILVALSLAWSL
jgi:hypothetical protein